MVHPENDYSPTTTKDQDFLLSRGSWISCFGDDPISMEQLTERGKFEDVNSASDGYLHS